MDKEFWEACGIQGTKGFLDGAWTFSLPSIDLNNLFKYAVPKAKEILSESQMGKLMVDWLQDYLYVGVDPTQSLYKALSKVFGLDGE